MLPFIDPDIVLSMFMQGSTSPLASGQYIYGRASQTEQRSARWASWYPRATWASNFRFFQPVDFSYIRVIQYLDSLLVLLLGLRFGPI
jgi:hypothetical protein